MISPTSSILLSMAFYSGVLALARRFYKSPLKKEGDKFVELEKQTQNLNETSVVYIVYSYIVFSLGIYSIWQDGVATNRRDTELEKFIQLNAIGYFIYDTLAKVYLKVNRIYSYIHHAFAILNLYAGYAGEYSGSLSVFVLVCSESTSFFWIQKLVYDQINYPKENFKYQLNLWILGVFYLTLRGPFTLWAHYRGILQPLIPMYVSLAFSMTTTLFWDTNIQIINCLWKSLPNWFNNPKQYEKTEIWILGRKILKQYTQEKKQLVFSLILCFTFVLPTSVGLYIRMT